MQLTKKKVFWISSLYVIYFCLLLLVSWQCDVKWCQIRDDDTFGLAIYIFAPLAPVFLFSLVTYFLREEVFQVWMRFAKWWIPLSIFFVLIMPDGQGGGYMPSLIDKQTIAFLMSSIFILVSLTKIISKSIELRKK